MLVLLVSWLPDVKLDTPGYSYDLVEMFAGEGMVSRVSRLEGRRCASIDVDYDSVVARKGAMDLTTSAGLVLPGWDFNSGSLGFFCLVSVVYI